MSEKKNRSSDVRPKSGFRSWSADNYIWPRKKHRSRKSSTPPTVDPLAQAHRSTSCPNRKCSGCSGDASVMDLDPHHKALTRRSLRQKFQDAVGQCLSPMKSERSHRGSVLVWSKRRVHVSELMQEKCPYSSTSELSHKPDMAHSWYHLRNHNHNLKPLQETNNNLDNMDQLNGNTALSWADLCAPVPGSGGPSLDNWVPPSPPSDLGSSTDCLLVQDLLQISNSPCYWGVLDRFEAEELLEGQPEGTFLLRDSAHNEVLFSVSFRRYARSLHARIEQTCGGFGFDVRDPCMYRDQSVVGLLEHYSDPESCLFFEPILSRPLSRTFPFSLQHLARCVICSCTTYTGLQSLPLPPHLLDYLTHYHLKNQ